MPGTEAPQDNSEPCSSQTSIIDWNSSESESVTLSDFEVEINGSNSNSSVANSTESTSTNSVASMINSNADFVTNSYTFLPIPGLENIRIPIDFNLRQLLTNITGTEDLNTVTSVRLRVIASEFSIQRIPMFLPNLRELNLSGSCLMTLRDLGCRMQSLQILHVSRTGLNSLDGLFGLSKLVELHASHNKIKDVSPCSALNQLTVLDLANNLIPDEKGVNFLVLCSTLKHLSLDGNPAAKLANYRTNVREILPDLDSLDGINFFDDEARSLNRSLNSLNLNENSPAKIISRFPPIFPEEIQKGNPALKSRPYTTGSINNREVGRLKMLPVRPATARRASKNDFSCTVSGSELKLNDIRQMFIPSKLTIGEPLCGNPALGLWEKKKLQAWQEEDE